MFVIVLSLSEQFALYDIAGIYEGQEMTVVGVDHMKLQEMPDALLELAGTLSHSTLRARIEKHYGTGQHPNVPIWLYTLSSD